MTMYDHRSHTVSTPGGAITQVLGGNSMRVSMVISSSQASPAVYVLYTSSDFHTQYLVLQSPFNFVMPYRDYGPLMQQPLFVQGQDGASQVTVSEVFIVHQ